MKEKKFSCNGRVNGVGDATFKCMNAGFHIIASPLIFNCDNVEYMCDACKKRYTLNELVEAQKEY